MSKQHARFSPSKLDALSQCIRFKYDESKTTDEASEGALLHEAAETRDTSGLTEDQKQDVLSALAYADGLKDGDPDCVDMKEPKLVLDGLTFGYSDRVIYRPSDKHLHVIDYKFTRVDGDHEFQARTYAAAFIEMNPDFEIEKCSTHIVAPRLNIIDRNEHDPSTLVTRVRAEITALYMKIDNPFNPPTPYGDLCARCARASECPALNQTALTAARGIGLPLPAAFNPESMVSVEDRAIGQAVAKALTQWAEQVSKNNTEFVVNGGEIPGYSLRTRSTGARVDKENTPRAARLLNEQLGIPVDQILEACRLSIPDLTTIHAATSSDSQRAIKEMIIEFLKGHDLVSEGQATYLQKSKRVSDDELINLITSGDIT